MSSQGFEIKGWHVLAGLIAFFGVIVLANSIFLTLAIKTFPGEHEEKSYLQGLNFNERLETRAQQQAMQWQVGLDQATLLADGTTAQFGVSFKYRNGVPITDLNVSAVLARPASDQYDRAVDFVMTARGLYTASVDGMAPGQWILRLKGVNENGQVFETKNKLILE